MEHLAEDPWRPKLVALKGGLWGTHCWRMHHVAGRSMSGTLIMGLLELL